MIKNKKIIFISYYYDEGFASGIQNSRFVESLLSADLEVLVVYRFSNKNNIANSIQIESPKFLVLKSIFYKFFPKTAGVLSIDEFFWILKVILHLRKIANTYDVIHVVSFPFYIQFIGLYFKNFKKKKWVMQLLDPISDNNYVNTNNISNFLLNHIEKKIVGSADLVFLNNRRIQNILELRYPNMKSKFCMLPLLTDPKIKTSNSLFEKITLCHSGSLYGFRNIDFIVNSLCLIKDRILKEKKIEILFIGNCPPYEIKKVIDNDLSEIIIFIPYMPQINLYEYLSKSDGLLLIDSMAVEGVFTPSKLCEYFSFQKIIFAITPKESVVTDILEGTNHLCFNNGDEVLFSESILEIIENREKFSNSFNKNIYKEYLPDKIVKDYNLMINSKLKFNKI
nr:hypothetical protein [uncultured Flavobacterium sp.]